MFRNIRKTILRWWIYRLNLRFQNLRDAQNAIWGIANPDVQDHEDFNELTQKMIRLKVDIEHLERSLRTLEAQHG